MKSGFFGVLLLLAAGVLNAYPMDPNKVPVSDVDLSGLTHPYTLAYDSDYKNIVYYAPRGGRLADLNGQPLLGYTVLANGYGFLNAQLTFSSSGIEVEKLKKAIITAGYTPRVFPFVRTNVVPIVPGIDPVTGSSVCATYTDPVTGEIINECEVSLYEEIKFSSKGPSLQANIAISASLNPFGAVVYKSFLRSGNALQINLETLYYKAGDGFKAVVTADYNKMIENFHSFASYHDGFCTNVQIEKYFKKEGLCVGRDPATCGITLEVYNSRGDKIPALTLPPTMTEDEYYDAIDNPNSTSSNSEVVNGRIVWQAVERLMQRLRDDMLTPIGQKLSSPNTEPTYGFKLDVKWERQVKNIKGRFEFNSPNGVNYGRSVIASGIGCTIVEDSGKVSRDLTGDCKGYWDGSLNFDDILDAQTK